MLDLRDPVEIQEQDLDKTKVQLAKRISAAIHLITL